MTQTLLLFLALKNLIEKSNSKIASLGVAYIPFHMGKTIKEFKFHVIIDNSFAIEKDELLGGRFCKANLLSH